MKGLKFGYIGTGQCGGNIANEYAKLGYKTVAINTSLTDLSKLDAIPKANKLLINVGLQGAGKNPEIGKQSLIEHIEKVLELIRTVFPLDEIHTLFVCAGLGGGTGGGMIALLSQVLIEEGYKVNIITTLPFDSESDKIKIAALNSFEEISNIGEVGATFIIDNAKASKILKNYGLKGRYSKINEHIALKLHDINQLTEVPSEIAFDMRDFETLLNSRGSALITTVRIEDIDELKESQSLAQYIKKSIEEYSIFCNVRLDEVKGCAFLFELPKDGGKLLTEEALQKMNEQVGNPFEVFYGVFESDDCKEIKLTTLLTGLPFPMEKLEDMQNHLEQNSDKLQKIFENTQTQVFKSNSKDFMSKFITNNKPITPQKKSGESTLDKILKQKK